MNPAPANQPPPDTAPRVLLFGGTFDPIHHGHLIVSRAAAEELGCHRVVLIPSARPPHKQAHALSDGRQRLAMARAAVAGEPDFAVSDWEMSQEGPSYTLRTVQHFQQALRDTDLYWLIGMDSLAELHTWYRLAELVAACTFVTATRPGDQPPDWNRLAEIVGPDALSRLQKHVLATPAIEISATRIRHRVRDGRSIRYLVPPPVADYIAARGLYRA
jgi:nicotinate-nucleotide adenylyltransferase